MSSNLLIVLYYINIYIQIMFFIGSVVSTSLPEIVIKRSERVIHRKRERETVTVRFGKMVGVTSRNVSASYAHSGHMYSNSLPTTCTTNCYTRYCVST